MPRRFRRIIPHPDCSPAERQLVRIVDGAVQSALQAHQDYLTPKGKRLARGSIVKRVAGSLRGYMAECARDQSSFAGQPAMGRSGIGPAVDVPCLVDQAATAVPGNLPARGAHVPQWLGRWLARATALVSRPRFVLWPVSALVVSAVAAVADLPWLFGIAFPAFLASALLCAITGENP